MVKIFEFILVYPLHLSVFFSYILSFLQFLEQDIQLVGTNRHSDMIPMQISEYGLLSLFY